MESFPFFSALEYLLHDREWVASRAVCICVCISLCSGVASHCLCLHVSYSRGSVTETLNWGCGWERMWLQMSRV